MGVPEIPANKLALKKLKYTVDSDACCANMRMRNEIASAGCTEREVGNRPSRYSPVSRASCCPEARLSGQGDEPVRPMNSRLPDRVAGRYAGSNPAPRTETVGPSSRGKRRRGFETAEPSGKAMRYRPCPNGGPAGEIGDADPSGFWVCA